MGFISKHKQNPLKQYFTISYELYGTISSHNSIQSRKRENETNLAIMIWQIVSEFHANCMIY